MRPLTTHKIAVVVCNGEVGIVVYFLISPTRICLDSQNHRLGHSFRNVKLKMNESQSIDDPKDILRATKTLSRV